jgi:hypothetical protein
MLPDFGKDGERATSCSDSKYEADTMSTYRLRYVGHDSPTTVVVDGKIAFAVEEKCISRKSCKRRLRSRRGRAKIAGM